MINSALASYFSLDGIHFHLAITNSQIVQMFALSSLFITDQWNDSFLQQKTEKFNTHT